MITVVQSKSATDVLPFTVTLDDAPTTGNLLIAVNGEGLGGDGGAFPEPSYAIGSAGGWTTAQSNTNVAVQYRVVAGGDPAGWAFASHARPGDNDSARITLIEISGDNLGEWTEGVGDDTGTAVSAVLDLATGSSGQGFLVGIASYGTGGPDATALTDYTLLDDASIDDPDTGAGYAATVYRIVDPASGSFTIGATLGASADWFMAGVAFIEETAPAESAPGLWVDWDGDGFGTGDFDNLTQYLISINYERGAAYEITGAAQAGSANAVLQNPDGLFDPDNAAGPLFGLLHDGPAAWFGVNDDGSLELDPDKTIYGRFAGYLTDINPIPAAGSVGSTPTVQLSFAGPFDWYGRTPVKVKALEDRTQGSLRRAILDAMPETRFDLATEIDGLPLSSANGMALDLLSAINAVNGTRHFARPQDVRDDWYKYTTRNRWYKIGAGSDASIETKITNLPGWRVSADTVINQQSATTTPVEFIPAIIKVWEYTPLPLLVTTGTDTVVWAELPDYVRSPSLVTAASGALTAVLTPLGDSQKITLSTSDPTSSVTALEIWGYPVTRLSDVTYIADDPTSQAVPNRGVRAGPSISGDYVGTIASATGIALHMVWRYADPKKRPSLTVTNWIPTAFTLDLYDVVDVTVDQLQVAAIWFEIVGLAETVHRAVTGGPVYYETTYTLSESPVQELTDYFTWDVSTWDGPDTWAYL